MKIVGYGVCGPGEADKHMRKVMEEFKRLCDTTVIVLNNATKQEYAMVTEYGFKAVEDNREWGKQQWRIKQDLLDKHIAPLKPNWCISLDMDEVFDPSFTRESVQEMESVADSIYFYFITLWDDGYQPNNCFWNVRAFKWTGDTQFKRTALHPGLAPKWAYEVGVYSMFYVKHYGLKDIGQRQRKIERYEKYDPESRYISRTYYDSLRQTKCAELDTKQIKQELIQYWSKYRPMKKKTIYMSEERKFVYLRREIDGALIDVEESRVEETLARGGFSLAKKQAGKKKKEEPKVEEPAEEKGEVAHACGECDKSYKTERSLKSHITRSHK